METPYLKYFLNCYLKENMMGNLLFFISNYWNIFKKNILDLKVQVLRHDGLDLDNKNEH